MPSGDEQPTDLGTGEVLNGAWRLEEKIGEGGMGRVFRATDLKLARKAAVKALSVNNLDEETVKRFEREAQVMGKLDHPGVVTLYGVGRTRGVPWLAMKHLEGRSLWGVLDENEGKLSPSTLLPIARQLLVALGYIHGRGLLHRDLKPSNIHVGFQGKTTLLDLGLARGHKSTLTRTGVIWGTPDYMAPEQIVGERQLDGRADLYSVSVVFYRMLSGTSPFPEEDEHELLRAHLMNPRPDISRVVPGCSLLLGAALQKGLAIRPEDRFQTAEEMRVAIERAMSAPAREAATVVRPSSPEMPRRRTGENLPVAADVTPKAGGRRVSNPNIQRAQGSTASAVAGIDLETSSGPTAVVIDSAVVAAVRKAALEEEECDSARTARDGFAPPSATHPEGLRAHMPSKRGQVETQVDSQMPTLVGLEGVREAPTVPSEPHAQPLHAPAPGYLTAPFLIGAAVILLILGMLLGKLL